MHPVTSSTPPGLRAVQLVCFCSMCAMRICDSMLGSLAEAFEVSVGEAAGVIAFFAVAYGVMQLLYGPLGDLIGKQRVILGAACACALLAALTALSPHFAGLLLARAAMGAAAAGIIPMSMAWVGDQVHYAQRQETLARLLNATLSGLMFGQWFGGFAADHLGWRSAFAVLALLFALAAYRLHRHLRQASGHPHTAPGVAEPPARSVAASVHAPSASSVHGLGRRLTVWRELARKLVDTLHLLRLPRVRWVLGVTAVEGALLYGCLALAPTQLARSLGLGASATGALMAGFGIGGLLYSKFAGRWLRRLGERGLVRLGGALMVAGMLLWAWAAVIAAAALACVATGLGFYMVHNTLQTQATQMAPEARGTAFALFACVLFMGQSLGVAALAYSAGQGRLPQAFTLAALAIAGLCALIARRVQPRVA